MRTDRPNRGSSPRRPSSNSTFLIDSLSALKDYLKHRPKAVREVGYKRAMQKEVTALLAGFGISHFCYEDQKQEPASKAPVWARVEVHSLNEDALFALADAQSKITFVALDHITDPRNLGAVARSAAFMGVRAIIVPRDRQVLLTESALATAQAAFCLVDLVIVTNLQRTLQLLKERGCWIIGADMAGEPLAAVAGQYDKTVLVFGSEDKGLSRLVRESCDRLVTIDGAPEALQSLNVSVAAGITIHAFQQKNA